MDVDGGLGLVVVCAVAAAAWVQLAGAILVGRFRARRAPFEAPVMANGEWRVPQPALEPLERADLEAEEARTILLRGLRSGEPELRAASVTALGRLGERHEWAVDGLVEALARGDDDVVKVATQLDRLAPRAGPRLPPLLGHPNGVVRFYAVRLLASYEGLAGRHVPEMTADPSPNVRAAALETLRVAASGEALRCALRLLEDANPLVRAHASRTASSIAPLTAAPFLVPLLADRSWWVREAAREGLVAAGRDVDVAIAPALESGDDALRTGAALVLQDVGLVDELVRDDDLGQLERIFDAGGRRLRTAAADRARLGVHLGTGGPLVESA